MSKAKNEIFSRDFDKLKCLLCEYFDEHRQRSLLSFLEWIYPTEAVEERTVFEALHQAQFSGWKHCLLVAKFNKVRRFTSFVAF